MVLMRRAALFGLLLIAQPLVWASDGYVLKFATLAPEGSTWMNLIAEWAERVEHDSQGQLRFKLYPGGVAGDEPDVLRKIRFGQLQGSAITGHGIGLIYPPARVLEMPFMFQDDAEVDYVRERLRPEFGDGFFKNGFELVGWIEVGWVRYFSKAPIRSIDDLRQRRIWLWQGDPLAEAFFAVSGLAPVPLAITEVFTSLSTGLLDTVYSPPLAAVAMQWFTKAPYMTTKPMTNGIGALVIDKRFFDRLPKSLQALLRDSGHQTAERMIAETRRDNAKSLDALKQQGVHFVDWRSDDAGLVLELRNKAAYLLAQQRYIPAELFERVLGMVDEYRARAAPDAAAPPSR